MYPDWIPCFITILQSVEDNGFIFEGKKHPAKFVVIVSHGDICGALLGRAGNTPFSKRHQLHDVATGSISEIIITDSASPALLSSG
jgi:broad specificity phosphatase PhoE